MLGNEPIVQKTVSNAESALRSSRWKLSLYATSAIEQQCLHVFVRRRELVCTYQSEKHQIVVNHQIPPLPQLDPPRDHPADNDCYAQSIQNP